MSPGQAELAFKNYVYMYMYVQSPIRLLELSTFLSDHKKKDHETNHISKELPKGCVVSTDIDF